MKNRTLTAAVCLLGSFMLPGTARGQSKTINLTGSWQVDFHDDNGGSHSAPKLVLTQTGDKLTGSFGLYSWPVIGTVDGNSVVFTFVAFGHEQGRQISDTVFYWGSIDPSGVKMKGRMKNPKEAGDWIATRQ